MVIPKNVPFYMKEQYLKELFRMNNKNVVHNIANSIDGQLNQKITVHRPYVDLS